MPADRSDRDMPLGIRSILKDEITPLRSEGYIPITPLFGDRSEGDIILILACFH